MTDLPILGYKRHSPPVLKDKLGARDAVLSARKSGSVPPEEKYLTDELQRIENSLDTNSQQTRTVNDGVIEVKQTVIDLTETVETNASTASAAITTEATLRVSADEALAQLNTDLTATVASNASTGAAALATELIVRAEADSALASSLATLSATVSTGDASNASAITTEQTARANADESLTQISNTQRALFGAAVSDNWDSTVEYTGSTIVVGSNTVGTGDDVVYGGFIYRCKDTHTNQVPPNTLYWDRVDTVDAKVSAAVLIESTARSTADTAQAATSTALSGRVSTLENDGTNADAIAVNASDIVDINDLIVTNEGAAAERFQLTAARFGITVADTYDNARTYQVGEEAIYSTILYRCKAITSGNLPTNTLYWDFQQLVPAAISAAVQTETTARTTADTALANNSTVISGRVTTLENDTTNADAIAVNASDIVDIEEVIVTNESATAERFQLTAARLGITVADTYDSAREYQVGEEAIHSAILYRCTAITTGNVPTDTSYWSFQELVPAAIAAAVQVETNARATAEEATAEQIVLTAARIGVAVSDTYNSTRTYQIGEEAVYSSSLYRCKAITTGNLPTNTSYWDLQELVTEAITAAVLVESAARVSADGTLLGSVNSAIASAATAQSTADGKIDTFYQDDAPSSASVGDLWFDTNDGNTIYRHDGSNWVAAPDSDIALAISNAAGAQNTADGKVASFYQNEPPTAEGTGDLWVDTNDGNKLYRWSGSTWTVVQDTSIPALEARYGVALNANGYITGFSQNNDGTTGSFKIIADDFRIIDPSDTIGEPGTQVFSVINGIVTMGTAHIGNLSIGTGKLEDNAATVLSTTELASAVTLSTTSLVLLMTLSFTGSVAAAEVHATFTASGSGSNTIRLHYYHNDVFKVARYKQYDGTTITLPITTTSGANTIKVYGQLYTTGLGSASINEGYVRCLETKK